MRKYAVSGGGLTPSLQQLRNCRHTIPSNDIMQRSGRRADGCITCRLAERVMKDIEKQLEVEESRRKHEQDQRELVWARAKRNTLLMRHPTNWAASLFQGTLPSAVPKAYGPTKKVVCDEDTHSSKTSHRRRPKSGGKGQLELVEEETAGDLLDGNGLNCRPILLPGTLLTLSCDCGCALTDFAEEVQGEPAEYDEQQERKALEVVAEALAEREFVQRRDGPRTKVLVKKLQAAVRGWLARRLARSLLLEGGCRREFDQASGAWQYVWSCRRSRYPNAHVTPGSDGRNQPSGEEFRSWYPPAMLKKETLPSPRTAIRRVEAERRKREARLALANFFLEDQTARLQARETRSTLLLSLGELIRLVERAINSLKGAYLDPPGSDRGAKTNLPRYYVRVLHPRGGAPGDAAQAAAMDDTVAAWRRQERKARKAIARGKAEKERGWGKSLRSSSPKQRESERRFRTGETSDPQYGGSGGRENYASLPSTNDNLANFEQRLLDGSSYETAASLVASLLRRRRVVLAFREGVRLGRNKDAWAAPETSPVGLGVQLAPPWLRASQRFIVLAHHGKLTAISQASPHVFWATLASGDKDEVLKGLLAPFLVHADLLQAMFCMPSINGTTTSTETTVGSVEAHNLPLKQTDFFLLDADGENGRGENRTSLNSSDGNHNSTIVDGNLTIMATRNSDVASRITVPGKNVANASSGLLPTTVSNTTGSGGKDGPETSGYRASLAPLTCWKLDANAAARRDESVNLSFDSVAFDVIIDLASQQLERFKSENMNGTSVGESGAPRSVATRALVTNVVPFRLEDGLPPDLTPLLFDAAIDAPILAGREVKALLSKSAGGKQGGEAVTYSNTKRGREQQPSGGFKHILANKEAGVGSWTRRLDPLEVGEILTYRHRVNDEHTVEVRIRGDAVESNGLARAGLPADLSKLVVGLDGGDDKKED